MPSPFPGMNPYLEQAECWTDFHNLFIARLATDINSRIPEGYFAKVEERLYIHDTPWEEGQYGGRSDVGIRGPADDVEGATATSFDSPLLVEIIQSRDDSVNLPAIEIRSRAGREIVTVVELLSPCNKHPGDDWHQFAAKRRKVLLSSSNYVEIDVLRGGRRHDFSTATPSVPYYVMISIPETRPKAGFWPIGLPDPLPALRIPLKTGVSPVAVDCQAILHLVYDEGLFRQFAYDAEPEPPLSPADAAWASQFVPGRPA